MSWVAKKQWAAPRGNCLALSKNKYFQDLVVMQLDTFEE